MMDSGLNFELLDVAFGMIVGMSLGLTGGGGSIFAVPLLTYGLGVPVGPALGLSLASVGATAGFGAALRLRTREIELQAGVIFSIVGMVMAPIGAMIGQRIAPAILLSAFAVMMGYVGIRMWRKRTEAAVRPGPCATQGHGKLTAGCYAMLSIAGAASGLLSGLFGVGGGFVIVPSLLYAGITVAAGLRAKAQKLDIAVIDPSEKHYYQPLWTLVGGGVTKKEVTEKREADLIPRGVTWIRDAVIAFEPDENRVRPRGGPSLGYDYLVVCPGIQGNWEDIKGLKDTMGRNGECSNYDFNTVDFTCEAIRSIRQETAIFTMPATPIKCAGAPQKIMYLAEDHFRRAGVRDAIRVVYASASPAIFGVAKYRKALEKVVADRRMQTCFRHNLIEVRGDTRQAIFTQLDTKEEVVMKFDLLHVTPPMSAPDFIRESPLADKDGWVEVDKYNLQHPRFPNIFALGDASSLPTSRTGAAIRKEAPVLVENLLAHRAGQPLKAKYNGYSSCPLVTGYGKLILAEFDS